MLLTMIDTRESDRCTDPLLVKIRNENDDVDEYNDSTDDHQRDSDVKNSLGAKWRQDHNGLIRNRRNHDETISLSFNAIANKKRLLVFLALIILIIYINTMAISWNDDQQSERVSISHQSHVPGMKDDMSATSYVENEDYWTPTDTPQENVPEDVTPITIIIHNTSEAENVKSQNEPIMGAEIQTDGKVILLNQSAATTLNTSTENVIRTTELQSSKTIITTNSASFDNDSFQTTFAETSENLLPTSTKYNSNLATASDDTFPTTFPPMPSSVPLASTKMASPVSTKKFLLTTALPKITSGATALPKITSDATASPTLSTISTDITSKPKKGFLVWTEKCQIPDLDPFAPAVKMHFEKLKTPNCAKKPPLTDVTYDEKTERMTLNLHRNLFKEYDNGSLNCSFKEIKRTGSGKSADTKFELIGETYFNDSVALNSKYDSIIVFCHNSHAKPSVVYSNVHPLIQKRASIDERLRKWKQERPVNVILFGIDSISRMNLLRTMPKTANYARDTGWFDMAGYNKIGDNTYPNLMAIFTGYNDSTSYSKCKPKTVGGLDKCPFIWKDYRKAGYVTAYAEDLKGISTFNYLKVGFKDPPTDYYLRPTMIAAESHLNEKNKLFGFNVCQGPKLYVKVIYDYALQLRKTYPRGPYFGIYWTNSLSHNSYIAPSALDEVVLDYLKTFNSTGILDDTIVFFFSDHGMRWGPLRSSSTGHLEERLPFFKIWLPQRFQQKYPELVEAVKTNQNRFTTPFDFHVTLKHILQLSGYKDIPLQAEDCPGCQSLFKPMPADRSCEDAHVEDHWCTCRAFHHVYTTSAKVKNVTQRTIDHMNRLIQEAGPESKSCDRLVLKTIRYANLEVIPDEPANSTLEGYQLSFVTNPGGAEFETTVRQDTKYGNFTITGKISRTNSYAKQSKCVNVEALKKFCACKLDHSNLKKKN